MADCDPAMLCGAEAASDRRQPAWLRRRCVHGALVSLAAMVSTVPATLVLGSAGSAQVVGPGTFCSADARTGANPAVYGCWTLPSWLGAVGINAALLHTGAVLLYGPPEFPSTRGSDARLLYPHSGESRDVSVRSQTNLLCSGVSLLPDGRVLASGGLLYSRAHPYLEGTTGTANITVFDPSSDTWSAAGRLSTARWYPTNVELGDGATLVIGGQASHSHLDNSAEVYDATTRQSVALPDGGDFGDYPKMFLLPDGSVAKVGPGVATRIYSPLTGRFGGSVARMNFGDRQYGADVLLPGLNEVLAAGGSKVGTADPTRTAELLNLTTDQWTYTGSMSAPRIDENLVLLPDGSVLSVGGGGGGLYGHPETSAELYDPVTGTWAVLASQTAQRTYHSTALLLPDGRVLSAGSDQGPFQNYYEIFSPPYLFAGARPALTEVPASVSYGRGFTVTTPQAANIAKVALIAAGATTHGVSMGQRYVALGFTQGTNSLSVVGPADGDVAPPGWYMLFIVNKVGVPSVAAWVDVG